MKRHSEDTIGWVVSVVFHLTLLLVLWMIKVPVVSPGSEFIEVSWSAVGTPPSSSARGYPENSKGAAIANRYVSARVRLPERVSLGAPEEILKIPDMKKLTVTDFSKRERSLIDPTDLGEKGWGIAFDEKEKIQAPVFTTKLGDIKPPFGVSVGGDSEPSVGFEVAWAGGGMRRLMSGKLPEYPVGVNLEAQIKIRAVVIPDGSVKVAHPIQKANTKLEEAALKEVRFWKFEPLGGTRPQIDQTCTITFNFLLR